MKTKFNELITEKNYLLNSKIFDLGRQAEIIAKVAQDKIEEDGQNAMIYASNIVNWMAEIAEEAQKTLDLSRKKNS